MQGRPFDILLAVATAFVEVWIATAGVLGYFMRPLSFGARGAVVASGVTQMIPRQAFPGAIYVEIAGFIVAAAIIASEFLASRKLRLASGEGRVT